MPRIKLSFSVGVPIVTRATTGAHFDIIAVSDDDSFLDQKTVNLIGFDSFEKG